MNARIYDCNVGILKDMVFYEVLRYDRGSPGEIVLTHPDRLRDLMVEIRQDPARATYWRGVIEGRDVQSLLALILSEEKPCLLVTEYEKVRLAGSTA